MAMAMEVTRLPIPIWSLHLNGYTELAKVLLEFIIDYLL